jgi:hypothetical protein
LAQHFARFRQASGVVVAEPDDEFISTGSGFRKIERRGGTRARSTANYQFRAATEGRHVPDVCRARTSGDGTTPPGFCSTRGRCGRLGAPSGTRRRRSATCPPRSKPTSRSKSRRLRRSSNEPSPRMGPSRRKLRGLARMLRGVDIGAPGSKIGNLVSDWLTSHGPASRRTINFGSNADPRLGFAR